MDLFHFDSMEVKKTADNHLPSLRNLFRCVEFCVAVLLLFWIFNRLPFAIRISGEFLRQIAGVIVSPLFVFFLFNAIIVTLIVKSDRFSATGDNHAADNAETQLYEELLKNSKNTTCSKPLSSENSSEEIEFQDKEIISQVSEDDGNVVVMVSDSDSDAPRVYRRWKSEKLERKEKEMMKLRRSETEKLMKTVTSRSENGSVLCAEKELSAEEFQRAVDDFIAKHLRFRRQEFMDVSKPEL